MMKSREREKRAIFSILDLGGGGRGGLSVPFKMSKIVTKTDHTRPDQNNGFW